MEIRKLDANDTSEQAILTRRLIEASEAYYGGKAIFMSDIEFDGYLAQLRQLEQDNGFVYQGSPTTFVGAQVVNGLKTVRHEKPALSLDKTKYAERENLIGWLKACDDSAMMSWKCDGGTIVATYDDGRLKQVVTRGNNGVEGSDITHNARYFKGLPLEIPCKEHVVVRCESMMTYSEFERINEELGGTYENPRNLATATIQMLDSNESRKREIIIKAHELVTPGTDVYIGDDTRSSLDHDYNLRFMSDRYDWLEALGFDVVERELVSSKNVLDKIEEWKSRIKDLEYPTDGLVFFYNDLEKGMNLGVTTHHPRWGMALKWTDETKTTTIRDIEWSVGKTGVITPVAIFDPVRLGLGSTVTRASLHNLSIMKRLANEDDVNYKYIKLIGSKAEVYLANMIIPQIASIEETESTTPVQTPCHCPSCSHKTTVVWNPDNNVNVLYCTNKDSCPAQLVGMLMNTFSKDGLFIKGLGESQIIDLLNVGLIDADTLSVYKMEDRVNNNGYSHKYYTRLLERDGWGQKKWDNLIDAINASRNTTLQKFLYSLNIPLLGNDLSKKLAKYWNNDVNEFVEFVSRVDEGAGGYDDYGKERAFNMLVSIDGVGDEKARNIVEWAEEVTAYREKWEDFINLVNELEFEKPVTTANDNSLAGLTFVITGNVHIYKNRDEFKASVEARGGKVSGSISSKTTALINNDITSTSSKNKAAISQGVEIISEEEFIRRYGK
ncbi:MAG: NAD-dependent DNA ligase LigA [Lachnospiraceae bacterium]|nr:NAD-dependent DNA ligase LigA [Lachnospiraceae bacterium]